MKNKFLQFLSSMRRYAAMLLLLLTCVTHAWAVNYQTSHGGFWADGGVELKWTNNASTTTTTINNSSISGNSIGTITTALTLSKITVKGWNTDHYANICEATVYFELYKGDSKVTTWSDNTSTKSWSGSNCTFTMNSNKDFLALTTGPGNYTIRVYAKITGADTDDYYGDVSYKGCSTTTWWYNNETTNGYYSVTFTIPSKNLTVNGAANGNTVSGSVNGITKGTAYDITATPTTGYGFTGWTTSDTHITIADASSPSTTVTFNNYSANATVTANFAVEETHDVAVSYKCGAMTIKTGTTESGVGVTSTRSVTAPAINDHTFSSWTKGSGIVNRSANLTTNPIVINTAVGAAAANCTLTANYTLVTCSLSVGNSATYAEPGTKYLMSYDADEDAYYYDMASSPANLYFRFCHATDSKIWSGNWNTYPNVFNVDANGSKIDCGTNVNVWGEKASLHFSGLTGSPIRIWFDFQNKKAWITETTYTVNLTSENTNKGTVDPSSVTAGKNTASETFTATPKFGYKFKQWSVTSPASLVSSVTTNPNTVKATGSSGAVQAQFDYRWVLRGSINSSDDQHGMPGWSTITDYFTGISAGGKTGTITVNLEAHTKYKFKVYDLVDGAYYSKASVDWTGSNNVNTEKNVSPAITFTTTASGPYTFTFNFDTKNVAIAYPTSYVINFSAETFVNGGESHSTSTTGGTVAAVDGYSISLTSGWQVKAGGSVEITATKKTGYTFEGFYTNAACTTAVSGADVSISDNVLTFSGVSETKTVYAKFSENMTTVTLVANPTGKGSFTKGGAAVTSVSAGVTTKPSVTAVPIAGYRVNTSATVWTKDNSNITLSSTTNNPVIVTGCGTASSTSTLTALFTPIVYTITLDDNDGSGGVGSATVTFEHDDYAYASSFVAPERTGYIFEGYYTASDMGDGNQLIDDEGNWVADANENYTDEDGKWIWPNNKTLYAGWTPITYTVTYHANGGSAKDGESDPTVTNWTYDVDQYISVSTTYFDAPTKYTAYSGSGTESKYWNDSEHGDGTDYEWEYTRNLTSTDGDNIDLYAQWYTRVNLMKNHEDGSVDGYTRVRYNQHVTYMSLYPSRTGYLCTGYYTATDGGTMAFDENGDMVSGDVSGYIDDGYWIKTFASEADPVPSFYAHWSPIHYDVTFDPNDGEPYVGEATGSMDPVENVAYEEYVDIRSGYAREGYTFSGWSKTIHATSATYMGDSWRNISYTDGDDVTLYAVWSPKTYTITFNALEGDCYTPSTNVNMGATYGGGYELPTAYGKSGYEFVGWFTRPVGGTEVTKDTRMVTASDHTLYAHYTKVDRVYFKNTLGWENVYVTWDADWNYNSEDKGAGSRGKTQELMTNISGTDIWYKDIPAAILSSWKEKIAFTEKLMSNYDWFDEGQAVFRRDFDKNTTLFVPMKNDPNKYLKNQHDSKTGTTYYSTATEGDATNGKYKNGYWVKYEDLQAGYTLKGSWDAEWGKDHYIERSTLSDSVFVYTIKGLSANADYWFKLWKLCATSNTKGSVFSTTTIPITSATAADAAAFNAAAGGTDAKFHTTVAGDYTFKFNFSKTGVIKLTIEYPFKANDYRVVYSYTKGSAQTFSSEYIKASPSTKDTISMFIHSGDSATARSLYIQKCTGVNGSGVPTWGNYREITLPSVTASGKTSGVYNFIIEQDAESAATGSFWKKYDGNYYIRCDSADGGWDHYKEHPANLMTLSEYSLTQTLSKPYSHYYCQFIYTADISYTIATDYSPAICPILEGDATIGVGNKTLPSGKPASVRFTWNEETNETFRSYLKSAQGSGNARFLVLHGAEDDMIFDKDGNPIAASGSLAKNELLFADTENWVYELAFKAKPGAKVSIIARYNGSDRYLVGAADAWETIISGGSDSDTQYNIAAVYDFKTNRLITTWIPSGTISEEISEVDVLIERQYQGGGTTITFGKATEESEAGSISAKRVIGSLKFDYNDLVGRVASWTPDTRAKLMYFVSFPFDVNVSDIFGLNTEYGDAFVVRHYNSKLRAEKGFFGGDGTETFWEDMPIDTVMHANVGYVVVMDNDYMNGDIGHVWDNKKAGEHVYLYFPSANDPSDPIVLNSEDKKITLPEYQCNINRTFNGGKLNHKYTDSNWNVMGVPIFQPHTGSGTSGTPGAIFTHDKAPTDTTKFDEFGYFYNWATDKSYTVTSAVGFVFKPMHSYLVQYAGDVTFTQATPEVVSAPRRVLQNEENYKIELQVLNSDEEMLNRTYVELRENAVDSFALNEDLFMVTNKHAVNVYTFAGTYDVSANVLPIESHTVQVGVIVKTAGTYTFTMPSNFSGTVTLIDTYADTRTNLAIDNYEVNLPAGTFDDRFLLEINISKMPTAIDGTEDGSGSLKDGKAHKFIMNDMMYILNDGVLYDATGKRVK